MMGDSLKSLKNILSTAFIAATDALFVKSLELDRALDHFTLSNKDAPAARQWNNTVASIQRFVHFEIAAPLLRHSLQLPPTQNVMEVSDTPPKTDLTASFL